MSKKHSYRHLDYHRDSNEPIPMRVLAELVCKSNYGLHRFLSHVIDVRMEQGRHDDARRIQQLIEENYSV